MIALSLGEAAAAMDGELINARPETAATALSIDSRAITPGALFFALLGEQVDGHQYVESALANGASAVVVSKPVVGASILVADVQAAMGRLGRWLRDQLSATVVGVTGSVGKTTTKDYLAAVLELTGPTVAPPNSFNNEIGLPLTIAQADAQTRTLILEMGARGIGHIRDLCRIGKPQIGVVLTIGSAHIGEFGSREAIAVAKRELVESLPHDGVAVLNADDDLVVAMAAHTPARVLTYGVANNADVRAANVALENGHARFTLHAGGETAEVTLHALGLRQQLPNALAAAAVGHAVGMKAAEIAAGLSAARSRSHWRMELTERPDGVSVINDAYNASPEAVRAAIETLAELGAAGRRTWMVLGRMAELGDHSVSIHEEIGASLGASAVSRVLVVGESARPLYEGARSTNKRDEGAEAIVLVPDIAAATQHLDAQLRPGDIVLVKAARAENLQHLAIAIGGHE